MTSLAAVALGFGAAVLWLTGGVHPYPTGLALGYEVGAHCWDIGFELAPTLGAFMGVC